MQTKLMKFRNEQFGEIRSMLDEMGEPWFVGKDVAKALGYVNTRDALQKHVEMEDKTTVAIRDTGSNYKSMAVIINESGLYSLILSSKLKQAKAFKRWVTSEVLPQIRKTGGYIPTKDAEGNPLKPEEILERAHAIVAKTLTALNLPNYDCFTASRIAADWGMETREFNKLLSSMGIIYRKGGRWHLSEDLQGMGLAEDRYYFSYSLRGEPRATTYLVWTPEGVDFLKGHVKQMPAMMKPKSIQLNIVFNY